jgi:transaldolase / glucose-6-phosphate isomerase
MNPLRELLKHGQSVWLDYIRRDLITSGELKRLITKDGLRGMTSNPAIFEKAIAGSDDYKDVLDAPESRKLDAKALYEKLAIRDIQDAADLLRPVHEESRFRDGYVSLEVSPKLAHDTHGTLEEARRLWKAVNRPNLMIKVPATPAGLPAIRQLLSEGINVNITLLFAQSAYEQVAEAYLAALEKRAVEGQELRHIASVASFFVSRIDTLTDSILQERLKATKADEKAFLHGLLGKTAIANAKLAYQHYLQLVHSPRWEKLAAKGAQTQRLLWASTSTKNPAYRDVIYVEELIGPDTVNTIPPATFDAFRDHGQVRNSLTENLAEARNTLETLAGIGISLREVTDKLLVDAVKLFDEPFDKLLKAITQRRQTGA